MMLDIKECCRLCMKPKTQALQTKDCAGDPLAVPVMDIFGIELDANGKLSTKICRECMVKVMEINLFKSTVHNNQASLEQTRILQESLLLNPSVIKDEGDDDVILVESDPNVQVLEENTENVEIEKQVETFAKKRSLTLAQADSSTPKEFKLKKAKVLISPITENQVSNIRLTKSDRMILNLSRKKGEFEKKSQFRKINKMSNSKDSEDEEYNDDGTVMTLQDYADKYNKKKSNSKQFAAISTSNKQEITQILAQMNNITPRTRNQTKLRNLPGSANQLNNKPSPKTTKGFKIPAISSVESPPEMIVPATVTDYPLSIISNVYSLSPPMTPKSAKKVRKSTTKRK